MKKYRLLRRRKIKHAAIFQKFTKSGRGHANFIQEHTKDPQLAESMVYSVKAGGKRIRPLIILTTIASFRGRLTKKHTKLLLH